MSLPERDPMLDAIDCRECGREFLPAKPSQKTCGRPSCNGGKGARTRDYSKKKLPGRTLVRKRPHEPAPKEGA